jgi:GWxTD domain-containing protein
MFERSTGMFTPSSGIRGAVVALALAVAAGSGPSALAQDKSDGAKPDEKRDRKKRRELEDVFKRWLKEDVVWIISPEEKAAFEKLATDEEREQFIEQFWLRRDPDPNTPENETREEHYRRIAYANQHFTSGVQGWRTDRGRVYIAWGPPHEKESYQAGSQYNRLSYEGGGSTTVYAFERWWYRHLDGVGDDVELEFVDRSGTGDYRIAFSPEDKDALANVPNAGLTQWEALGLTSKADRAFGNDRLTGMPANRSLFAKLETWADISKGPGAHNRSGDVKIVGDVPIVETNALPFSVRADFFRISESAVVTSLTVQLENADLAFENKGGVYSATVNVYGTLHQLSGRNAGRFEDVMATPRFSDDNLALGQQQKSVYRKVIMLPPGNFRIDVLARDVTSGKTGLVKQSFVVPRFQEGKLATSSVVLAQRIEPISNRVSTGQFDIGRFKVIPNVASTYKAQQLVPVFMHVYDTQLDQTSLRPTLDVEYVILHDGKEVKKVTDSYPADEKKQGVIFDLAGSQLVVARGVPTDGLAPGEYKLRVRVTDRVAQKTIAPEVDFTLTQ